MVGGIISSSRLQIRGVIPNATIRVYITKSSQFFIGYFLSLFQNEMTLSLPILQSMTPYLEGILAKDSLASLFISHHLLIQCPPVSNKFYVPLEGGST